MNKAFLRGLVVAAVLLINCTLLSGFIERQMTVPVRECSPRYDNAVGSQRIPADAIRWEDGQSFLYAIQEGQGLTAGLWAERVPVNVIGTEGAAAFVMEDESQEYVLYGSRPFQDVERVLPVEEGQAQPDTLLLWMPAGASPLEQGVTIPLGEGEATLYSREVTQPFLAERELAQLAPEELRAQSAVISCQELEKLLNGLPWLAGAALLALATLLLAILFCVALGRGKRWPWYLGCGVGCFWLGWAWFLCWAAPSCPLRCCQRAISLLGATTATCSSWRKRGWQLSRRMPAARSSSTFWGSGSGRPCSFWREGRRCSACFLSRWGCISEGALVHTRGAAVFLLSERREAINRKVGIGDALV